MKRLCIVPCGAGKVWDENPQAGPTPARRVYTGPFAKKCREYAQLFFPDDWCILSAKYGFLLPEDLIPAPYNVSFNDPRTNPITLPALRKTADRQNLLDYDQIIVLGGKNYVRMIEQIFRGKAILTPLAGCTGIGYMLGKLKSAIDSGKEIGP